MAVTTIGNNVGLYSSVKMMGTGSTTPSSSTTSSVKAKANAINASTTVKSSATQAKTTASTTVSYSSSSSTAKVSSTTASAKASKGGNISSNTVSISASTTMKSSSTTAKSNNIIASTTIKSSSTTSTSIEKQNLNGTNKPLNDSGGDYSQYSGLANKIFVHSANISSIIEVLPGELAQGMLNSNQYLSRLSYTINGNRLIFKGIMSGSIPGVGSVYTLESLAKNAKATKLVSDIDKYSKLSKASQGINKLGKTLNSLCIATSAATEILDPKNETIVDKVGGATTEVGITIGEIAMGQTISSALGSSLGTKLGASLGTAGGPVGMAVGATVGAVITLGVDSILDISIDGIKIRDWIANGTSKVISLIGDLATASWDATVTAWEKAGEVALDAVSFVGDLATASWDATVEAWNYAGTKAKEVGEAVSIVWDNAIDLVSEGGTYLCEKTSEIVDNAIDEVCDTASALWDEVCEIGNSFLECLGF